jgi:endo-1,4-beta-xylanase
MQGHNNMKFPSLEQQDATIEAFAKLGIKVNITELDIDVLPHVDEDKGPTTKLTDQLNPFTSGLPQSLQTISKAFRGFVQRLFKASGRD